MISFSFHRLDFSSKRPSWFPRRGGTDPSAAVAAAQGRYRYVSLYVPEKEKKREARKNRNRSEAYHLTYYYYYYHHFKVKKPREPARSGSRAAGFSYPAPPLLVPTMCQIHLQVVYSPTPSVMPGSALLFSSSSSSFRSHPDPDPSVLKPPLQQSLYTLINQIPIIFNPVQRSSTRYSTRYSVLGTVFVDSGARGHVPEKRSKNPQKQSVIDRSKRSNRSCTSYPCP